MSGGSYFNGTILEAGEDPNLYNEKKMKCKASKFKLVAAFQHGARIDRDQTRVIWSYFGFLIGARNGAFGHYMLTVSLNLFGRSLSLVFVL